MLDLVNLIVGLWIVSELIIVLIKDWLDQVAELDLHILRYNVAEVRLVLATIKIVNLPHIVEVCRFCGMLYLNGTDVGSVLIHLARNFKDILFNSSQLELLYSRLKTLIKKMHNFCNSFLNTSKDIRFHLIDLY